MKKIAILLPGLLRTYDKTSQHFFQNIIKPNQEKYLIDTYLGFWNYTHKRGDNGLREEVQTVDKDQIEEILDLYKPKEYIVLDDYEAKNSIEFPNIVSNIIETLGRPNHPDGDSLLQNGLVAQTYTWHRTYSLLKESYDYVMKTRFDIATEKIFFDDFIPEKFNCAGPTHQFSQYKLADTLFCSNQKTMENIMYKYHEDIIKDKIPNISESYPNVFPEYVLKDYLKRNNIKINYLNKKVYIVR